MNHKHPEPTSPVLRLGVAVFFLCIAALAITYAWREFERAEVKKTELERIEKGVQVEDANEPISSNSTSQS